MHCNSGYYYVTKDLTIWGPCGFRVGILQFCPVCSLWTSRAVGSAYRKELLSVNAGPQTPLEALSVDLDLSYCTWELVIARDQDLCEGAIFYYFLWEIVQDRARSCRTW